MCRVLHSQMGTAVTLDLHLLLPLLSMGVPFFHLLWNYKASVNMAVPHRCWLTQLVIEERPVDIYTQVFHVKNIRPSCNDKEEI